MEAFTALFHALDATTSTSAKVAALDGYFRAADPADAAWALHFLSGNRIKRLVKSSLLRKWGAEASGFPIWLVDDCYETVGDLAETLALLVPPRSAEAVAPMPLAQWLETRLLPLARMDETRQREALLSTWARLDFPQRLVWNKLITGSFRIGVSRTLLVRALAGIAGVPAPVMEHRLMGDWQPTAEHYTRLLSGEGEGPQPARPYPFYLASPLEVPLADLGAATDWQCEWKWDGIRAQLLRRAGECVIWSRGEEIITPGFPEIAEAAMVLPEGVVLDGELLAWSGIAPLPFAQLQRRINRRDVTARVQASVPVVFMAYDLLEHDQVDVRPLPLDERRARLEQVITASAQAPVRKSKGPAQGELFSSEDLGKPWPLRVSPRLLQEDWQSIAARQEEARALGTEGIMLKLRSSPYGTGRQRGAWWKWKVAPFTCDAVLVAAQPGHGRRATLFTDYTFALWHAGELVPVAKAYSGLTDEEIHQVDAYVRANTTGRFGPVRSVKPQLVFELAFEGVQASTRHRSGIALRFPRIARWRHDKKPADADHAESLRAMIAQAARNA